MTLIITQPLSITFLQVSCCSYTERSRPSKKRGQGYTHVTSRTPVPADREPEPQVAAAVSERIQALQA